MGIDRSRRVTFEETADLYNEVRPEYPDQLTGDIIRLSALPPEGHILEIGCGAGNATIAFAKRGYNLLGIELGEKLAGYARQRCKDFPKAVIVQSAFEDYDPPPHSFDLAISADAFHWIQPEVGYPKLLDALKPTGFIALFWQVPLDPQTEWSRAIDEVFARRAPQFDSPHGTFALDWLTDIIKGNFREHCGIEDVTVNVYDWTETLTTERFLKLMRTYSAHRGMDSALRESIYADICLVLDRFGSAVKHPMQAALFFAKARRAN
jgi:SAM-dependent methyltransferase